MAELNLGRVRPTYKGDWSALSTYEYLDWVMYNGSGFIALKNVAINIVPDPVINPTFWAVFGAKGTDGRDGVDGLAGPKGDKGDTGSQGIQGEEGPQGPPVTISSDWETNDPTVAFSTSGAMELKNEIDTLGGSSGIGSLTSRVDTVEDDVTALSTAVAGISGKVTANEEAITTSEAEITDLKTAVNNRLPLTGGTLTGQVTAPMYVVNSTSNYPSYRFHKDGELKSAVIHNDVINTVDISTGAGYLKGVRALSGTFSGGTVTATGSITSNTAVSCPTLILDGWTVTIE